MPPFYGLNDGSPLVHCPRCLQHAFVMLAGLVTLLASALNLDADVFLHELYFSRPSHGWLRCTPFAGFLLVPLTILLDMVS